MLAGQQITPTLRLVRPLGQGAMGSIWVADHLALGTQVAVKFMSAAVADQPDLVARFRREAMAAAQIKSPHVAQVFDHGIAADGSLYIVMELLEGEDLKHRVARLGPLPPRDVVRIVGDAAKALGRAHQLGIVHRDVKPDNLFLLDLDGEPFVKVLDFGIAKQAGAGATPGMTATGVMFGTPLYMSPEQFLSAKHADFRADLWSLAVVAYHALTGQTPFTGETVGAVAIAVNAGVFTPPSHLRPGLPPAVDAWMARALQRDPAARFGSARELAEALSLAVSGAEAAPAAMPSASLFQADTAGEAQARTLHGMAATGAGPGGRRAPIVIVAAALVAGLAISGGVLVVAGRGSGDEPGSIADAAAPGAKATSTAPDGKAGAGGAAASASAPVSSPGSASAPAPAEGASAPPADAGPRAKAPVTPRRPPPNKAPDDIGF